VTDTPVTIMALNPGSSSLKAAVRSSAPVLWVSIDRMGTGAGSITLATASQKPVTRSFTGGLAEAVDTIAVELGSRGLTPGAVAHRVVHGGPKHYLPTVVDEALVADLRAAIPLAPLHLPGDLDSISHARRAWPDVPHVACFDTGFHHNLPERSRRLPVPEELVAVGVRRYGFHGLSVQSALHAHPDLGGAVIAHLGSGCSVTAVADGRPRHTTMSLTPTGGMVSATRAGDLDPEVVLYLIQQHGYTVDELRALLDRHSGLAGIAGGRHDMRDLLAAHDDSAALALDVFTTNAAMAIAACAATLDRWDSLVFTGGVGEHAEAIRQMICARLLVIRSGAPGAESAEPIAELASTGIRTLVVTADEEAVMDRLTRALLDLR
jgi:acetate kinase